jgi:phosphoglycolate phosphatase
MKNIRLLIFDLDGTLVDAYPAIARSFNYAMLKSGYPPQDSLTVRRAVGYGDENLLKPFIKIKDIKNALLLYRRHHKNSLVRYARLFAGSRKVLHYLKKKGYHLAVASNRPARFSRILIRHLGIGEYFDYILCADRLRHLKPHPEILEKIVAHFSLSCRQAVFIGDMAIDAQAARRAGIRAILVPTGSSTISEIRRERPYLIIKRITDVLKVF